jgi:hypothetical protein
MKHKLTRKLILDLTLDSSEAIIFTKGGKHKIKLDTNELDDFTRFEDIEISICIEDSERGRFKFITEEAISHKARALNETQSP